MNKNACMSVYQCLCWCECSSNANQNTLTKLNDHNFFFFETYTHKKIVKKEKKKNYEKKNTVFTMPVKTCRLVKRHVHSYHDRYCYFHRRLLNFSIAANNCSIIFNYFVFCALYFLSVSPCFLPASTFDRLLFTRCDDHIDESNNNNKKNRNKTIE